MIVNASSYADLNAAVAAVDLAGGGTIVIDAQIAVSANLTIPQIIAVRFEHRTQIAAANTGIKLIINGPFDGPDTRIFYGFGSKMVEFDRNYAYCAPRMVHPEWWGARDGNSQDQIAVNEALHAGDCVGLQGSLAVSGTILLPYGGYQGGKRSLVGLYGHKAKIYATVANIIVLQLADSFCNVRDLSLWGGHAGITLMALIPEGGANNLAVANQNHNYLDNIDFNGADEALVLMAGKAIGGQASGCWYNRGTNLRFSSVKRCIWLKDNGSTDILSSGSNSNEFSGEMNGSINTGMQIDAGGGNIGRFKMENINLGTTPNALPTGIIVRSQMANGGDNPNNRFHDWHGENVYIHAEIDEPTTEFFGSDLDHAWVVGTARLTFLDDGKSRIIVPTMTCSGGGTITLDTNLSFISCQESDGSMNVRGYVHVASVSGAPSAPTGVLHLHGVPRPALPDYAHRSAGVVAASELNLGSGAASVVGRVMEGSSVIDIFGSNEGALKLLAPYIRAGSNFTINVSYPVR